MGRVFANGPGVLDSIPGCVIPKTLKWYLIPPCLTLSNIRYGSRVEWSNPGKGVAPFPTPRCSCYQKGSLLVALDYDRQLYFYLHRRMVSKRQIIIIVSKQFYGTLTNTTTPNQSKSESNANEWILHISQTLGLESHYQTKFRCPWCNCYRRRKWTRRHEFKFWTTLTAFHIALIPMGEV